MGRAAVRQAAQTYLQNANLPYLGTVFYSRPEVINEDDYENSLVGSVESYVVSPLGSSAVMILNIPETRRARYVITGSGFVADHVIHEMELELVLGNTAGGAVDAQADHETLVDALLVTLRADPHLGDPSVVWAAGEFSEGITLRQSPPFTGPDGTTVMIVTVIHIQIWEDVEAAAGAA